MIHTRATSAVFAIRPFSTILNIRCASSTSDRSSKNSPPKSELTRVEIPQPRPTGLQASYKRGTGGRSSFSGNVVTVFGATGLIGRYFTNRLGKEGSQIIIPYRMTSDEGVRELRIAADLGQMLFFPFNLKDEDSIRKAVKHSNIVINLIGQDYETPNYNFDEVHVHGARRIARISKEMGVKRFFHISALNVNPDPPENIIPGGSGYLRSKWFGEVAVREEFPNAVIIRPAEMFMDLPNAYFEPWCHGSRRHNYNKVNVFQRGEHVYKMPLWTPDFMDGFMRLYRDHTYDGETFEFVGPYAYHMGDMVDWMYRKIFRGENWWYKRRHLSGMFSFLTNAQETRAWVFRRRPEWNWDITERRECTSDVLTGCPTLTDLGLTDLVIFDLKAPFLIQVYNRLAYMALERHEYTEPPPLKRYPQLRKQTAEDAEEDFQDTIGVGNFGAAGPRLAIS